MRPTSRAFAALLAILLAVVPAEAGLRLCFCVEAPGPTKIHESHARCCHPDAPSESPDSAKEPRCVDLHAPSALAITQSDPLPRPAITAHSLMGTLPEARERGALANTRIADLARPRRGPALPIRLRALLL